MSISSVIGLRIKNAIKGTTIGKKARDTWQRRNFNEDAAMSEIARFQKAGVGITVTDKLLKDMMHEAKDNSVGFDEYLMYHFADLPEYRRREFVPTRERITICEKFNGTKICTSMTIRRKRISGLKVLPQGFPELLRCIY